MEQPPRTGGPELSYARVGTDQAPQTRVEVKDIRDGVRFIDPPLATSNLGRRILIRLASQLVALEVCLVLFCVIWRLTAPEAIALMSAVGLITVWPYIRYWRQSARYPTMIDITSTMLALVLPSRERVEIPLTQSIDIHAAKPRRMIGVRGRISSLIISVAGRKLWLLRYRDYVEVRWLAREIRVAAGRNADHPAEPALRIAADAQEICDAEKRWSGSVPEVKRVTRSSKKSLRQTIGREYDDLGCAAGSCLALSVLIGAFVIRWLNLILIICISYGVDAYFKDGLRFVPQKTFLLTNGRMIGRGYQMLLVILDLCEIVVWAAVSLIAAIGLNRLLGAVRERRLRARRTSR